MKLFPIAPVCDLDLVEDFHQHLLLHHLLARRRYGEFYKKCSDRGDYLVFDNGGAENNYVDVKHFVRDAKLFGAVELQIPDVIFKAEATLQSAEHFFSKVKFGDIEELIIQIVPQGMNMTEYFGCLAGLLEIVGKNTSLGPGEIVIGVSKYSGTVAPSEVTKSNYTHVNRPFLTRIVHELLPEETIHLLGLLDPIELLQYRDSDYVRGVDSSTPLSHAELGLSYRESLRCDGYSVNTLPRVDLIAGLTKSRKELARENIKVVVELCSHVGREGVQLIAQ